MLHELFITCCICLFSDTPKQHVKQLQKVLDKLAQAGFQVEQ